MEPNVTEILAVNNTKLVKDKSWEKLNDILPDQIYNSITVDEPKILTPPTVNPLNLPYFMLATVGKIHQKKFQSEI